MKPRVLTLDAANEIRSAFALKWVKWASEYGYQPGTKTYYRAQRSHMTMAMNSFRWQPVCFVIYLHAYMNRDIADFITHNH